MTHAHTSRSTPSSCIEGLGDDTGQADAHRPWPGCWSDRALYREALAHAQQALELFRAAGHRPGQARALNAVGWFHAQLGDQSKASCSASRPWTCRREIGDPFGQADTLDSLGYAYRHLGHYAGGHRLLPAGRSICTEEFGDRYNEADSLVCLGDTYLAAGDSESAVSAWHDAR